MHGEKEAAGAPRRQAGKAKDDIVGTHKWLGARTHNAVMRAPDAAMPFVFRRHG